VSVGLSGCALPYYWQAAGGQMKLLRQREPIAEIVADPDTDADTRARLELVTELRAFAVPELDLPDNGSYTSYVDMGRAAVVWNVVAAPEFSIRPVTWCFPVAGCVAYRGYFRQDRAEAYGRRLRRRGFDVFVGGSPAYSTLGYFDDPVLNTMIDRGETELAAMLFHELAHQRVYVRNDTELSESFATAVEEYAVETWLRARGDDDGLARYRAGLAREREFADIVSRQRERLAALYASAAAEPAAAEPALRRGKAEAFDAMRREYDALRTSWGGRGEFDGWFDGGFNNARLVALTSYRRWVPGLKARLERLGPAAFYGEIEALTELAPGEREATLTAWNEASETAALTDRGERIDAAREVGLDDGLHALRFDAEGGKAVVAADVRDAQ
jgi:predicted aminopeptidase